MSILISINRFVNFDWIDSFVCIAYISKERWDNLVCSINSNDLMRESSLIQDIMNELNESKRSDPDDIHAYRRLFGSVEYHGNIDIILTLEEMVQLTIHDPRGVDNDAFLRSIGYAVSANYDSRSEANYTMEAISHPLQE